MLRLALLAALLVSAPLVGAVHTIYDDPNPTGTNATGAVQGLIARVLGANRVDSFELDLCPSDPQTGNDVFNLGVSADGSRVRITGNSGVAIASGLGWYLKYYCNASYSWGVGDGSSGRQLATLPAVLPKPQSERRVSPVKYRYALNVCTVSYSMAWWNWTRWEADLDWMALSGINLPLSFAGQEYVWYKFYSALGLTDAEIQAYLSGPAFVAWQRMGNIQGWGGPMTESWRTQQYALQKQFLARTREFGMINALPGFSGHVPGAIQRIYPDAKLARSHQWGGFNATYSEDYLLEPTDSHFQDIGKKWYETVIAEFGTDSIWQMDTYNEMVPSSNDPAFLAASNKAVYDAMAAADPKGVYLMQGWLFHEGFWNNNTVQAYLSGVPNNGMMILDLNTEASPVWSRFNNFFGKPWIWCMLHNYGGRRGLYGNLDLIATSPIADNAAAKGGMVGTGYTPEAIETNPIMYDLMMEMGWRSETFNVSDWVQTYALRRYGAVSEHASEAWRLLETGAYAHGIDTATIELVPSLDMHMSHNTDATAILNAWRNLQTAGEESEVDSRSGPYRYDLVDVGRQVLINFFSDVYMLFNYEFQLNQAQHKDTADQVQQLGNGLIGILKDLDTLLLTDPNFLLGHWLNSAKRWAQSPSEVPLLEFNARNQITLWGPDGNINDYAAKHWNGLVGDYYLRRWQQLVTTATQTARNMSKFDGHAYSAAIMNIEQGWNRESKLYPENPSGDHLAVSRQLMNKYAISTSEYKLMLGQDAPLNDIGQAWTRDVEQLKVLCDMTPSCAGFNSNGYLKSAIAPFISQASNFYVKMA